MECGGREANKVMFFLEIIKTTVLDRQTDR